VRFELLSGADLARIDRFRAADAGWDAGLRRFRLVVIAPGAHPALERALRAAGARTLHRDPHVLVLLR
jgi:hypothetical protein